eukprot:1161858-Pelagomonas_calceolata.AAC.1
MSFAAWLDLDSVFTPFATRQQPGFTGLPQAVTSAAHDDVQDEHVRFHCTYPQVVSLRRKYASLFSQAESHDASAFLNQNNNKLPFPFMN